jgi:hypothetical protein
MNMIFEPPGAPGSPGKAISKIFFPGVPGVLAVGFSLLGILSPVYGQ